MNFQAYAMLNWASNQKVALITTSASTNIDSDVQQIGQVIQKSTVSQFQKMYNIIYRSTSLPSQYGRWYYRPFNKDTISMVLVSTQTQQPKVEMFLDTIDSKIFDYNTVTPKQISNDQKSSIYNLLKYFDASNNKEPKQIQKILETLNNTKLTVQQNIENMLNNKDQLNTIEVKSLELDDSSSQFLSSATQLKNKNRRARLRQMVIIGSVLSLALGVFIYIIFG